MNPEFQHVIDQMEPLLKKLQDSPAYTFDQLKGIPDQGVYVFYENGDAIYVGRSNRIPDRLKEHGAKSSTGASATFALKLLRKKLKDPGGHRPKYPRKVIDTDSGLKEKFAVERDRVREMKVRVVEIKCQKVQYLFEAYAIISLGTTDYNTFDTY